MYFFISCILLLVSFLLSLYKPYFRKLLITFNVIISIFYVLWRITVIPINNGLSSFIFGVLLFSAEFLGFLSFINFQFLFTKTYKLQEKTLNDFNKNPLPYVDVLICTYNEPLSLLSKTIIAAKKMEYPKNKLKIYVCDDGQRTQLKHLCKSLEVNYITRNENEGAKAGNINNALSIIKGDLFAILDADMIPKRNFLLKTVGYFSQENTAFVQAPQVYYNKDMYQYNFSKNLPNEQDFFMRNIEEARAARNAVLHVGTNAVFRRQFVLDIGGYPTCSITEDMAVGLLLQSKGYDSIFVNEELVLGLSATTFSELVKQRDRWCRGNLQVMKKFNILFNKGLSLGQKISYLDGVIYWLSSLQKLIYLICPLIYLLTGTLIINSSVKQLLVMFLPFLLGQIIIFKVLSPKTRSLKWSHYYETAMAPHISFSVIKELFAIKTKFNVTSKDLTTDKNYFQFKIALPHIIMVIVTLLSWIVSIFLLKSEKITLDAYIINMAWSIYNFIGAAICIIVAYQKAIYRHNERIEIGNTTNVILKTNIGSLTGKILDISENGMAIMLDSNLNLNTNLPVSVTINNLKLDCTIARKHNNILGLVYRSLSKVQFDSIMDIYVDNIHSCYTVK